MANSHGIQFLCTSLAEDVGFGPSNQTRGVSNDGV
jgi:hypothetical protein